MNWLPRLILAAAAGWLAGAILVTEFRVNRIQERTDEILRLLTQPPPLPERPVDPEPEGALFPNQ